MWLWNNYAHIDKNNTNKMLIYKYTYIFVNEYWYKKKKKKKKKKRNNSLNFFNNKNKIIKYNKINNICFIDSPPFSLFLLFILINKKIK